MLKLYTYKITRDYGFAPNPYHGYCTLATCKPTIRSGSSIGDWVIGFGGKNTIANDKLVFIMRVDEKLSFDEYWNDSRFEIKKPCFNKSIKYSYGDNIYHHNENGEWLQENSHHSLGDSINTLNLQRDTGTTDQVLISRKFWYFGSDAITLSEEFKDILPNCRNCKKFSIDNINRKFELLLKQLEDNFDEGVNGLPFTRMGLNGFIRYDGKS